MGIELAQAWVTISANTRGMQRDIRSAIARAERDARVGVDGDTEPLRRSIDRAFAQANVQSRTAGRTIGQTLGREAGSALSRELKVAVGAVSIGSLPAVSAALATVAGSIQQVSQAGLALPGVLAGAGTSFATLKLGATGVGDAMKTMWEAAESGDAEDLKKAAEALSPNAKSAVTEVAKLHGSLSKLKETTQDNLFAGTDQGLRTLAERTLPAVNRGLDQTSKAWGATFRELIRVGADSSTVSIVDRIFGDTADAQNRANRAISPMVSALGELAATGTGSLPRIADGLTSVFERFDRFITGAASDGRLHQWIDEGIDGVTHLGRTTLGVGQAFTALTKAAGGGDGLLTALDRGATGLAAFMNSADGQSKLREFFADGREQLQSWGPILQSIPPIFGSIVDVTSDFTSAVLTPFSAFTKFLAEHAGLVKTAAAAWLLFRTVPGIIGGIQSRLGGLAIGTSQVTGQTRTLGSALSGMGATMRAAASANQTLVSSNGAILGQGQQLAGRINNYTNAYAASSAAMARSAGQSAVQFGRFGSAVGTLGTKIPVLANMQQAFVRSATAAERFGRSAGAVSAAGAAVTSSMGGIGKAAGGVVGALGGPWGAAFAGAGIAAMAIISQNQKSARSFEAVQESIRSTAQARAELTDALMKSRGAVTDDVKSQVDDNVSEIEKSLAAAASRTGSPLDNFRAKGESLFSWNSMIGGDGRITQADAIEEEANKAKDAQRAIDSLKLSKQGLRDVAIGSQAAFDKFVRQLEAAGEGGQTAAEKFRQMRTDFIQQQTAAQRLGPGMRELSAAFHVMGDATATASDKLSSLQAAMAALTPAASQAEAVGRYAEKVREVTAAAAGIGPVKVKGDGTLDQFDANSKKLTDALRELSTEAAGVATNGSMQDIEEMARRNAEAFRAWAASTGKPVAEIERLYSVYGGKAVDLAISLKGAPEATQSLALLSTEFTRIPGRKTVTMDTNQIEAARGQIEKLGFKIEEVAGSNGQQVTITANTTQAAAQLTELQTIMTSRIPSDKPISISAPGGQAVLNLLKTMEVQVDTNRDGTINVAAPLAPAVLERLKALGIQIERNSNGTIQVSLAGMEQVESRLKKFLDAPAVKTVTVVGTGQSISTDAQGNRGGLPDRAHGAIVPMANGGFRRISKPTTAGIYAGRGAGTIFAERETGGESYIPLAPGKRKRSTSILGETARLFGLQLIRPGDFFQKFEDGGISVDRLKQFAAGIQGRKYTWGGGGSTFDADCSGAQATIANYLTGASGRFSTANQGEALAARGFIMGDPPEGTAAYAIGWVNGGPGGGHTAGTIIDTDGSRVNVEMGGAGGNGQYGGQAAAASSFPNRAYLPLQGQDMNSSGGSGASDDSSSGGSGSGFGSLGSSIGQALFGSRSGGGTGGSGTSSKTTAATAKQLRDAQDKATDAEKAAAVAKQKVAELEANPKTKASALQAAKDRAEKTAREAAQAKTDLEELKNKGTGAGTKNSTDGSSSMSEFQSAGQGFVSGMLQAVGLDGSVFSNPLEWPNFKSGTALVNYLGSLAKTVAGNNGSEDMGGLVGGAGAGLGLNIPNLADIAKPQTPQAPIGPGMPLAVPQRQGDTYNISGLNPRDVVQKIDSRQNAAYRRQSGALV
ncbi:hypothetical protein TPB0596_31070 [Tsukamurella pulmonis]|uniref:hypothetical protein n=1 Tax=Tsukamurella pulmonis TaxID=47312 RepID=UPI001EDEBF5F|nr:hypothetical protein [Tsukamurella pulmonis]BDD83344.1 hypothetical protein TPB0596_31070 [Tsukamurella pulmonis]